MASSSFTTNLGLCQWAEGDRPKRADFVSDNQIIDAAVGTHLADTDKHLTAAEKEKIATPYAVIVYAGTGDATKKITTSFSPNFVVVCKKNAPTVTIDGGAAVVNTAFAAYGSGGSSGLSVAQDGFTVTQQSTAANGARLSLNESGCQYCAVVFK